MTNAPTRNSGPVSGLVSGLAIAALVAAVAVGWYAWSRPSAVGTPLPASAPIPADTPSVAVTEGPAAQTPPQPAETPAGVPVPVQVPEPERPAAEGSIEDVVGRVLLAVVGVRTDGRTGSGFFVTPDTIVTNAHVIAGATGITIRRHDGTVTAAKVVSSSTAVDVAVLKVAEPISTQEVLPLSSVSRIRAGQEVFAIGSPLGVLQNSVTRGIVSAVRELAGITVVQTDAAINPGNSGGPLVDRNGQAIGIATMRIDAREGLSFAVAADHALALLAGRSTPTSGGLATVTTIGPAVDAGTPSTADAAREQGARVYEEALTQLSRRADALDRDWASFKRVCYGGTIGGTFDREWFAVANPKAFTGIVARGCEPALAEWRQIVETLRGDLVAREEAARQAGVYPGVRRSLRARLRLDLPGVE